MELPDTVVTKLYLKYRHLPSLQDHISPKVKNPQDLSDEEVTEVSVWVRKHLMKMQGVQSWTINPVLALIEAGVTDEEVSSSTMHGHIVQREFCCFFEHWVFVFHSNMISPS